MDTTIVQSLFLLLTNNIFFIIYLFVAVEVYLCISIFLKLKRHEMILLDVSDNLLKGFPDSPDKDSLAHVHEKIQGAIQFITTKMQQDDGARIHFSKNAAKINERPFYNRHYAIETHASVMSTIVQIFPLLGILGTILAIAQTAFKSEAQIDTGALTQAFVLAMDTTILGIGFSILFMIIESTFQPKIERIIDESNEYRRILSQIHLS